MVEGTMLHPQLFGSTRIAPMRPPTPATASNETRDKSGKQEDRSSNSNAKIIIPNDPDMQLSIHLYEFVVGAVIVHLLCES